MSILQAHDRPRSQSFEGVMYTAYGDESADETQQRVFAIGGLFGNESDWRMFEREWERRTEGVIFHASDCETGNGDFEGIDCQVNLKLYADLSNLIASSNLIGCAIAVSLPDYRELIGPSVDTNPYYLCFHSVVLHLATRSSVCLPRDRIKFIFDQNHPIEYNAGKLYHQIINGRWSTAEFRQLMEDVIGFATRKTIGIQAADLVAREAMMLLDNHYAPRPTRLSTLCLQACNRFKFRLYDRGLCERFVRDSREAQYPMSNYVEWLEDRGLTPSIENKMLYEASLPPLPLPSSLPPITY